ncbi:MAG TPA: ATP-dependent metallopeptidase FtsH/Yme1/Tma family protein [Firmicutes bacterium]|uniref:ATP-dependent zinc metalloprotease FtsH n=1 Tax=Gelria sp. Kuro-4 TaxID=2796927 RepID=UPI001984C4C5|nr:ATP-dependent zinc metalloprotease FtsH [Gelria sp. Kuro-4]MDK2927643.1 cell division protease FtsH [Bacillota bacterium]BCV23404.1 ATP-dependent zinc metalloprotease FtsH [Gelria sp. Kuro-4]HHV58352.1 ATP-dependent metallopeptidase FtsH/Yme1/Tma family protein [Bacillota bacterium]
MNRVFRSMSLYLLLIIIALSIINYFSTTAPQEKEFNYTQFLSYVEKGEVAAVTISNTKVSGVLKDGTHFNTPFLGDTARLEEKLEAHKVEISYKPVQGPPWWSTLFSTLLPILLLIGVWVFIMQQTQGGGNRVMSFGRSRARLYTVDEKTRVTFADVAGADEAKEELQEIVQFLKEPKKFLDLGARIPKGVLLVGPPGTGKTLLAKAVAGEAGVPFFSISGSDFVEMFVGVGAARVRDLFEQAKKNSPCLVFIDEIDAVGRQRGAGLGGGHDEREQTLNQLLVEMDGFGVNEGVIVMAATNRPDVLDPALLRPGRFDRQVIIDQPDVVGREAILKVHARNKPLDKDVDLGVLARRTPGFTGADLANMLNEAAILTARKNKRRIGMSELEEAIDRVIAGPERRSRVISEREKRLVAYHEGGHAVLGYLLPNTDPVHKVSIIPRGRAGGYTLSLPKEDRYYMTRSELFDRITQLLGGRVAEELVLKEVSTGAQNDLERATNLVRKMITEYGMSEELGPLTFGHKQEEVFLGRDIARDRNYSEEVASAIDREVRHFIDLCYNKAARLLAENRARLDRVAAALLEKETLEADEFQALMKDKELEEQSSKPAELRISFPPAPQQA